MNRNRLLNCSNLLSHAVTIEFYNYSLTGLLERCQNVEIFCHGCLQTAPVNLVKRPPLYFLTVHNADVVPICK